MTSSEQPTPFDLSKGGELSAANGGNESEDNATAEATAGMVATAAMGGRAGSNTSGLLMPPELQLAGSTDAGGSVFSADTQLAIDCRQVQARRRLEEAAQVRLVALVGHLLHQEGLGSDGDKEGKGVAPEVLGGGVAERDAWGKLIVALVRRAVDTVETRTQTHYDESMDFNSYVKIKRLPGGHMSESIYVDGVVARKNVVHKRMRTDVVQPKIMLLGCALEFQRRQGSVQPMQQLLEQEEEYLKILVKKIRALEPDVVLVERTASRKVQTWLLQAGISLVINVKEKLLARIARLTGCEVTSRAQLDALVSATESDSTNNNNGSDETFLGTCARWYVKRLELVSGATPFMFFEGCRAELGCTLVLRGEVAETRSLLGDRAQNAVQKEGKLELSVATATLAELTDLARRIRVPAREIKLASAAAEPAQALLALVNGDKLGLTRVKRVSTLITREPAICCHFSYTTLLLF